MATHSAPATDDPATILGPIDNEGVVHVPAFDLPFSNLASPEAKAWLIEQAQRPAPTGPMEDADIATLRRAMDDIEFLPLAAKQAARYSVSIEPRTFGGIPTEVFTPKGGVAVRNSQRVLINLHGGGFILGAGTASRVESIPIASVGKITVISVDYRQGPENQFPSASEDVAAVYEALLKEYKPADIGIYGCSAGGILTGQSIAWFQQHKLPNPGSIGIFCASTGRFEDGDSPWISSKLGGTLPPPTPGSVWGLMAPYFGDASPDNPLAVPDASPELLTQFPPTLFISGTRAAELSTTVHSHIQLLKAGVDAQVAIWEAMDHGFFGNPDLPESREAYDLIAKFFEKHLGKR
jgi:acetyl esterase/lipase